MDAKIVESRSYIHRKKNKNKATADELPLNDSPEFMVPDEILRTQEKKGEERRRERGRERGGKGEIKRDKARGRQKRGKGELKERRREREGKRKRQ